MQKKKRFKAYGIISIITALTLLTILFVSIFSQGYTAFQETRIQLPVYFDQEILDPNKTSDWSDIKKANFNGLVKQSIRNLFPEVSGRSNKRKLYKIVSSSAEYQIRSIVNNDLSIIGSKQNIWVLADDDVDMLIKGNINRNLPENERRIDDQELIWIEYLESENLIKKVLIKRYLLAEILQNQNNQEFW